MPKNKSTSLILQIALLLLAPVFCFSQTYLPGYVIPNQGDTLKGFVFNLGDFRSVYFKAAQNDKSYVLYSPKDLRGFGLGDQIYESAGIKYDQSSDRTASPSGSSALSFSQDTLFLMAVVKGPKSIYSTVSKTSRKQFYIKVGNKFELLVFQLIAVEENGRKFIRKNNQFIGQLATYLNDCPKINQAMQNLDYDERHFRLLMTKYYACTGSVENEKTDQVYYKSSVSRLTFGLVAGATQTDIEITGNGDKYFGNTTYQSSTGFAAGAYLGVALGVREKRWSVINEFLISRFSSTGKYYLFRGTDYYTNATVRFTARTWRLNTMIRYKQPLGKSVGLFANVGVSNGFTTRRYGDKDILATLGSTTTPQKEAGSGPYVAYDVGAFGGLGLQVKRFSLEGRFHSSFGGNDGYGFDLDQTQYAVLAGFRIY